MSLQGEGPVLGCYPIGITLKGHQGHFGIHNEIAVWGQPDQHIGLLSVAILRHPMVLHHVFTTLGQTRHLQHPLQNEFPQLPWVLDSPFSALVKFFAS